MAILNCKECGRPVEVAAGVESVVCWACTERSMNPPSPAAGVSRAAVVPATVRALVKDECCNFINGKHQGDRQCSVLQGMRCPFFERAVLPAANPQTRYEYEMALGTSRKAPTVRSCACGEPLGARQRVCAKCRKARRLAAGREAQRNRRSPVSS